MAQSTEKNMVCGQQGGDFEDLDELERKEIGGARTVDWVEAHKTRS